MLWRLKDFFYKIKYFFQRMFRPLHTSDYDFFELSSVLARYIYPRLRYFRETKKHGYPSSLSCSCSDYKECPHENDPNYGMLKWQSILDEMLFAFEWYLREDTTKSEKAFIKKYGDVYEEKEEYRTEETWAWGYDRDRKNGETDDLLAAGGWCDYASIPKDADWWELREPFYHNGKLDEALAKRAIEGFKLFGDYFLALWD
jgi:hypothetical protein